MAVNPEEEASTAFSHVTIEDLLAEVSQYLTPQDMEAIRRAFYVANQAHLGTIRRSGEPYIQHPLEVALLLADMRIDADSIVAALLHDVVEDTDFTLEELREQFGEAVANIVDGVTKFDSLAGNPNTTPSTLTLSMNPGASNTTEQVEQKQRLAREWKRRQRSETVRKMLLAMAEDPRVVVLKLADRLHNMRTLSVMNQAQQQNKARETREIYAPLARRLGMALVQAELEDLSFSYLEPERYTSLGREVAEEIKQRQPTIDRICQVLQEEMQKADIHAEVHAWQKHLASINRKLEQSGDELSQIHDLISYRILVDNIQDCYLALGHIHALWRPKDGRIKDFIATPKLNGYQSLHTTVFCLDNQLAEIQIRTHEMQRIADYGIASYWYLKERGIARLSTREMIAWIEQLREWQRELPQNADEFVEAVKGDIFQEQIFVFTPKGEVKDLPRGSTPLDMAYRIHTDIGDHCVGARIITNQDEGGRLVTRIVPLDYELKGGEIVDILVSEEAHPTRDWLAFARTATARTKIRRYLKTYEREVNLQLGRERLDLALKALGAPGLRVVHDEDLSHFNSATKYNSVDDIYIALGREGISIGEVLEFLKPLLQARGEIRPETEAVMNGHHFSSTGENDSAQAFVKLANCCCPLPGDSITGVLNPNKGIMVHRSDCRTLRRYRGQGSERLIEINWLQIEPQHYLAPIIVIAHDRAGLLRDVAAVFADAGINLTAVASTTNASLQKAVITATLEIMSIDQLEPIFERLQQIKNVVSVSRDLGRRSG
ncbi:MAG TPA: bifunctional (p)ppGpp synthetase/guanosine-3',5'-bis(diphosphate) 3'-pyrophosphohydrolase [Ktedonobacteraceae bacterium]|nr:bifunctional (p)ppGpp synthetase/guanosine-3',5'-bis(diphosphate) 3'-pyrophosphohydrolase [Ktedonobacteraceae bacterium]